MLYSELTHPRIIGTLAAAGHGSQILIADANFPVSTATPATAARVYLNLRPGQVSADDVLATILTAAPIEAVHVMQPSSEFTTLDDKGEVPIFDIFRDLVHKQDKSLELEKVERFAFYEFARGKNVTLAIQTGETRLYGNIMLTIGVRHPKD
ncbi:hypothetical protein VKS41_008644 [Umbelopsis sp. WA50703]